MLELISSKWDFGKSFYRRLQLANEIPPTNPVVNVPIGYSNKEHLHFKKKVSAERFVDTNLTITFTTQQMGSGEIFKISLFFSQFLDPWEMLGQSFHTGKYFISYEKLKIFSDLRRLLCHSNVPIINTP